MYDKFKENTIVNLGEIDFESSRFEIWSGGKLLKDASARSTIYIKALTPDGSTQDGIEVVISSFFNEEAVAKKIYFDISYTAIDRIRCATIPKTSNCQGDVGFDSFLAHSQIRTREHKDFNKNEPYAAGLFSVGGILEKVTFSFSLSKLLIEFYR